MKFGSYCFSMLCSTAIIRYVYANIIVHINAEDRSTCQMVKLNVYLTSLSGARLCFARLNGRNLGCLGRRFCLGQQHYSYTRPSSIRCSDSYSERSVQFWETTGFPIGELKLCADHFTEKWIQAVVY